MFSAVTFLVLASVTVHALTAVPLARALSSRMAHGSAYEPSFVLREVQLEREVAANGGRVNGLVELQPTSVSGVPLHPAPPAGGGGISGLTESVVLQCALRSQQEAERRRQNTTNAAHTAD